MSKNVKINSVVYNEVGIIKVPTAEDPNVVVEYVDSSEGDISEADILKGKIGFSKGKKVVGTHTDPVFSLTDGVLSIT